MDKPISTSIQRKNQAGTIFRWAIIIAAVVAGFFFLRWLLTAKAEINEFRLATVQRGAIEQTISASGMVIPSFEQQINSPVSTEIKTVLMKSGAQVKEGDIILRLDDEYIRLDYESIKDQLALKKNNSTRLTLEYDKNLKDLEYDDQIKGLEVSSLEAQLADVKRLKALGSATQEEVEQAELNLKIANLQKKKLENELQFRKAVIKGDRENLDLEVQIQEKELRELERKLTETEVKAPSKGVLTWVNENIGQKVSEGESLARIADLESFRIDASCSDRYTNAVKVGMPVKVKISNSFLKGTVNAILPSVENNTLEFTVALEESDSPLLRPNMQVEVFLISDTKQDALRVNNGPAFTGGALQEIFVVRGDKAVKEQIKVGLTSRDFIEIAGGNIQAGEKIIVSNMRDYEHLEEIALKSK